VSLSLIVFSTDDARFEAFRNQPNHKSIQIIRIKDAGSIAEAYGKMLECKDLNDTLIFIHDDVKLISPLVEVEPYMQKLFDEEPNCIIGLAGCQNYDPTRDPHWWNPIHKTVGIVNHAKNENGKLKIWSSNFGRFSSEMRSNDAAMKFSWGNVVDGLFMAMRKDFFMDRKPFQTANGNHFYDIRASLMADKTAILDYRVVHFGLGDSMYCGDYENEKKRLISDYKTAVFNNLGKTL